MVTSTLIRSGDRQLEHAFAVTRECSHHVTFAQDPRERWRRTGDDDRTDATLAQDLQGVAHGTFLTDGGDFVPLRSRVCLRLGSCPTS